MAGSSSVGGFGPAVAFSSMRIVSAPLRYQVSPFRYPPLRRNLEDSGIFTAFKEAREVGARSKARAPWVKELEEGGEIRHAF